MEKSHPVASLWRQLRCQPCSRDSLAVFGKVSQLRERCSSVTGCKFGMEQYHHSLEREEPDGKKTQVLTKGSLWELVSDGNERLWFLEMGIKHLPPLLWAAAMDKGLQLLCPWDELGKVAHRENARFEIIPDKNNLFRGSEIYQCTGCVLRTESEVHSS